MIGGRLSRRGGPLGKEGGGGEESGRKRVGGGEVSVLVLAKADIELAWRKSSIGSAGCLAPRFQ